MTKTSRGGVQVRSLTWTPFASPEPLLRNISFEIGAGERVLLVGPSGSGKSTLLRAIAGVLTDTESGEFEGFLEADLAGLLLQDPNDSLVSDTLYREVAFGLENSATEATEIPSIVSAELTAVGLAKPLEHPSTDLSGGEMQRMAFAGVLAMRPKLILLDEPTSMLDQLSAASVRTAVSEQVSKTSATMIVVEHEFAEWLPLVERMLVLNQNGELILDGEPNQIIAQHRDELLRLGLWLPNLEAPAPALIDLGNASGGRITVLTGASGAGKTTELKKRLSNAVSKRTASKSSTVIGYLPQQSELTFVGDSIIEATEQLTKLGISHLVGRNPYEISGGEQRRLALANALSNHPAELFLDEPTVGQDRGAWSEIIGAIIAAKSAGTKLTIATHDPRLIEIADDIVEIRPDLSATEAIENQPAPVSALAILGAPILLLLGSMRVTSISAGLAMLAALAVAAAILGIAGYRIKSYMPLIPGLIAVASIGLSNWYLSVDLKPETGLVAAMRVAAFVFPGILLASGLRPIAMGDQLVQWLRLPARPVVAAVAAMQRLKNLIATWDELRLIHDLKVRRREPGMVARMSVWFGLVFGLLVQSIRSAGSAAVAMDSRGFSSASMRNRTWAKNAVWGRLDWLVLLLALVAATAPFLAA